MTDLAWMKTYIGTETALTGHLTAEEFGAYERLRRHYWQHSCLPADEARLMRVAGVEPDRWPAIASAIHPLLAEALPRLDQERGDAAAKREKKIAAGLKGAQKRWGDRPANGNTNSYAISKGMAEPIAKPLDNQWPSASASEEVSKDRRLATTRTHAREKDDFIPAPRSEADGLAMLQEKGVFPPDYDSLLPKLMRGELRQSELDAA